MPPSVADALATADAKKELEGKPLLELLKIAQENAILMLTAKVMAGTITHQELATLRNLLRDNGMILGTVTGDMRPNRDHEARPPLPTIGTDDE